MEESVVGERLKALREGVHLSQAKLAAQYKNVDQPAIFRYERGYSFPPYHVLMQYEDYFDVSLDYIFGRADAPQGKLYQNRPFFARKGVQFILLGAKFGWFHLESRQVVKNKAFGFSERFTVVRSGKCHKKARFLNDMHLKNWTNFGGHYILILN